MGIGLWDNEEECYVASPDLENGLWLELDPDRNKDVHGVNEDDDECFMWIIPNGYGEIEGSDSVAYVNGAFRGRTVEDVLNQVCRRVKKPESDPRTWEVDWKFLGFQVVNEYLKRWDSDDGYYHA